MGKKAAAVSLQGSQQTVAVLFHFPSVFFVCFSRCTSELKLAVAQSKLHVFLNKTKLADS